MADKQYTLHDIKTGDDYRINLHDKTDGNFIPEVYVSGGGGGGGAVTVADGADVTQGAKADSAATDNTSSWSVVALLKGLYGFLSTLAGTVASGLLKAKINISKTVVVAPTVTASAYSSGYVLGGLQTIANADNGNGYGGILQAITINCKASVTVPIDIIIFKSNPSNSTFTDRAAVSVNAADFDKIAAVVHLADWTNLGTPSAGFSGNLSMPYDVGAGGSLYAVPVARGSVTPGSTSDYSFAYRLLQN